jgi:hypothetical protein
MCTGGFGAITVKLTINFQFFSKKEKFQNMPKRFLLSDIAKYFKWICVTFGLPVFKAPVIGIIKCV